MSTLTAGHQTVKNTPPITRISLSDTSYASLSAATDDLYLTWNTKPTSDYINDAASTWTIKLAWDVDCPTPEILSPEKCPPWTTTYNSFCVACHQDIRTDCTAITPGTPCTEIEMKNCQQTCGSASHCTDQSTGCGNGMYSSMGNYVDGIYSVHVSSYKSKIDNDTILPNFISSISISNHHTDGRVLYDFNEYKPLWKLNGDCRHIELGQIGDQDCIYENCKSCFLLDAAGTCTATALVDLTLLIPESDGTQSTFNSSWITSTEFNNTIMLAGQPFTSVRSSSNGYLKICGIPSFRFPTGKRTFTASLVTYIDNTPVLFPVSGTEVGIFYVAQFPNDPLYPNYVHVYGSEDGDIFARFNYWIMDIPNNLTSIAAGKGNAFVGTTPTSVLIFTSARDATHVVLSEQFLNDSFEPTAQASGDYPDAVAGCTLLGGGCTTSDDCCAENKTYISYDAPPEPTVENVYVVRSSKGATPSRQYDQHIKFRGSTKPIKTNDTSPITIDPLFSLPTNPDPMGVKALGYNRPGGYDRYGTGLLLIVRFAALGGFRDIVRALTNPWTQV